MTRRALAISATVLLLVAGGVVVFVIEKDAFVRELIERAARDAVGRDVRIDGALQLDLGAIIRVSADRITIDNAEWASAPSLVSIARLAVAVEAKSVLFGPLLVQELRIEGLDANLEVDADGVGNWPTADASEGSESREPIEIELPLVLVQLEIVDAHLGYIDARSATPIEMTIHRLVQREDDKRHLVLDGEGMLDGRAWRIEGEVSPAATLLNRRDISHRLMASFDALTVTSKGTVKDLDTFTDFDLELTASGKLPSALATLSPLFDQASEITAQISVTDTQGGIAGRADLALDDIDAHVEGRAERPLELDGIEVDVTANGADLARIVRALGYEEIPSLPFQVAGRVERHGRRLVIDDASFDYGSNAVRVDAAFPEFPKSENAQLELSLAGTDLSHLQRALRLPGELKSPYSLSARLIDRPEGLELLESEVQVADNVLSIRGPVGNFPGFLGSRLQVELRGPNLAQLGELAGVGGTALPTIPVRAKGALHLRSEDRVGLESLVVHFGDLLVMDVVGDVELTDDVPIVDVAIGLEGASLAAVGVQAGVADLPSAPFTVRARAQGHATAPTVDRVRVSLFDAVAELDGKVAVAGGLAGTRLRVRARVPDTTPFLGRRMGAHEIDARLAVVGDMLEIDDGKLSGPHLAASFAGRLRTDLDLEGARLTLRAKSRSVSKILDRIGPYVLPDALAIHAEVRRAGGEIVVDRLSVTGEAAQLDATGRLRLGADRRILATLRGEGRDFRSLGQVDSYSPPVMPFEFGAHLALARDVIDLAVTDARIGGSSVGGRVVIDFGTEPPKIVADLTVPTVRVSEWVPADSTIEATRAGDARVIPDLTIPVDTLRGMRLDVKLQTGPLGFDDPEFAGVSLFEKAQLGLTLENGALVLDKLELRGSRGTLTARGTFDAVASPARLNLTVGGENIPLGLLASAAAIEQLPRHKLEIQLAAAGSTLRELSGSLSGRVLLEGGSGTVYRSGIDRALGSFTTQLFEAVDPQRKKRAETRVECTVLALTVRDGIADLEPGFVTRTHRMDVRARGRVDLNTEGIRINFESTPRTGLRLSAGELINPFVQVVGTLGSPRLTLNRTGAAVAGTAAAATGGVSILGRALFKQVTGRNPCGAALKAHHAR